MLIFSLFGDAAMRGAARGLELFWRGVLPALFPFSVCIGCLKRLGFFDTDGRAGFFALLRMLLLGAIAGNPTGSMLMDAGRSDAGRKELQSSVYTALFNLASPVFITGAVCSRIFLFRTSTPALILFVSHYGSSIILFSLFFFADGTISGRHGSAAYRSGCRPVSPRPLTGFGSVFPSALYEAAQTMLKLCAAIVFFVSLSEPMASSAVVCALPPAFRALAIGAFEMTNGISLLASAAIGARLKLSLTCLVLSFGGICIFMQANSISPVRASVYLVTKLIHGALAFYLCYALFPLFFRGSAPVFGSGGASFLAQRALSTFQIGLICLIGSACASLAAVFASGRTRS